MLAIELWLKSLLMTVSVKLTHLSHSYYSMAVIVIPANNEGLNAVIRFDPTPLQQSELCGIDGWAVSIQLNDSRSAYECIDGNRCDAVIVELPEGVNTNHQHRSISQNKEDRKVRENVCRDIRERVVSEKPAFDRMSD